ncbi:MAG: hypothetical protein WCG27_01820 [Pseudomonadota bacterium]
MKEIFRPSMALLIGLLLAMPIGLLLASTPLPCNSLALNPWQRIAQFPGEIVLNGLIIANHHGKKVFVYGGMAERHLDLHQMVVDIIGESGEIPYLGEIHVVNGKFVVINNTSSLKIDPNFAALTANSSAENLVIALSKIPEARILIDPPTRLVPWRQDDEHLVALVQEVREWRHSHVDQFSMIIFQHQIVLARKVSKDITGNLQIAREGAEWILKHLEVLKTKNMLSSLKVERLPRLQELLQIPLLENRLLAKAEFDEFQQLHDDLFAHRPDPMQIIVLEEGTSP